MKFLMLCAMLAVSSCALFASRLPDAEKCAPTPASLAAEVADILTAGGDMTAALDQLAVAQTEQAVFCAVEAFLSDGKFSSSSEAKARARSYLASKGRR